MMIFLSVCLFCIEKKNKFNRPFWKQAYKAKFGQMDSLIASRKQTHFRIGFILSITVVEFVLFQMPTAIFALATLTEKLVGTTTLGSGWLTLVFMLWYLDSAINPMWTVFITTAKTKKTVGKIEIRPTSEQIQFTDLS